MKPTLELFLKIKTDFPDNLFDVIIGVLLGDASLQKNDGRIEKWRLKFSQKKEHSEYVQHLHDLLKDYVRAPVYIHPVRLSHTFTTFFDSRFNGFAEIFINQNGKKSLCNTSFFKDFPISAITLAYWFMDDGGNFAYNPRRGFEFNTQGFLFEEVLILSENLNKTFKINSKVVKKKKKQQPSIVIATNEGKKMRNIIFPYVLETMRYKLPITD